MVGERSTWNAMKLWRLPLLATCLSLSALAVLMLLNACSSSTQQSTRRSTEPGLVDRRLTPRSQRETGDQLPTISTTGRSAALVISQPQTLSDDDDIATRASTMYTSSSSSSQQRRRRRRVADLCESRLGRHSRHRRPVTGNDGKLVPIEFFFILVDDSRRLLYCQVPKVACTSWRRMLVQLQNGTSTENWTDNDIHGRMVEDLLPRLHKYSPDEIEYRLTHYFKFLFVRNPFDRLVSAYNDKFRARNWLFHGNYGRRIVSQYRVNASRRALSTGSDVTFDEFVRYLVDNRTRLGETREAHWYGFDAHWRTVEDLCHPCRVGYDFIGKYETLDADSRAVLRLIGAADDVRFPGGSTSKRRQTKVGRRHADSFANVTTADVKQLWHIYFDDFALFEYPYPSFFDPDT